MKSSHKQKGLSLIELSVGLVIVGLVIAGALAMYNSTSSSQRSTQLQSDLQGLRATTRGLFSGQTGYGTALLNEAVANAKKLPGTWVSAGTGATATIKAPGNIAIKVTGIDTTTFKIEALAVPKDVCISLLTALGTDWVSVKVGALAAVAAFPIAPDTANTQCAAATNDITLTSN